MSFADQRRALLGQLVELEAQQKKVKGTANNALLVLNQKLNFYTINLLELDEDAIASAASDLQQALKIIREAQTHIDNIKHQING